jgi:prepilin signal peptidase PulO-like enzyme (type II secretory pathway)
MLSHTDAACGVIGLVLWLRIYESPLKQRKVQRKTMTHTPTSHEIYRVEAAKLVQNRLMVECPLFDEKLKFVTLQPLRQILIVEMRSFQGKRCPLR